MLREVGPALSSLLTGYYRAPNHPCKLRIWAWIRRGFPGRLTIPYAGGRLSIDERDLLQRRILGEGFYEPEIYDALMAHASAGEVLWDVGANIGSFAVRGMLDGRIGKVLAFEPDPGNFSILQANVHRNGGTASTFELALGDCPGTLRLSCGSEANRGISSIAKEVSQQFVEVQCTTMDEKRSMRARRRLLR